MNAKAIAMNMAITVATMFLVRRVGPLNDIVNG